MVVLLGGDKNYKVGLGLGDKVRSLGMSVIEEYIFLSPDSSYVTLLLTTMGYAAPSISAMLLLPCHRPESHETVVHRLVSESVYKDCKLLVLGTCHRKDY